MLQDLFPVCPSQQRQTHHYHEHIEKSVFHGQVLNQTVSGPHWLPTPSPGSPGCFIHSAPSIALGGRDAEKAVSGSSGEYEQGPATPCLICSSQSPSRRRPRLGRGSRASSSLNRDVSKVHRSQFKGAPTDQIWDNQSTKTNNDGNNSNTLNYKSILQGNTKIWLCLILADDLVQAKYHL